MLVTLWYKCKYEAHVPCALQRDRGWTHANVQWSSIQDLQQHHLPCTECLWENMVTWIFYFIFYATFGFLRFTALIFWIVFLTLDNFHFTFLFGFVLILLLYWDGGGGPWCFWGLRKVLNCLFMLFNLWSVLISRMVVSGKSSR